MAPSRFRRTARRAVLIAVWAAWACEGGLPTQPEPAPPSALARGGQGGGPGKGDPGFVLVELPPLPGHEGSAAGAVNDGGVAVGSSHTLMGIPYPVLWAGNEVIPLTDGLGGYAEAVGNGAVFFAVGVADTDGSCSRPARWQVDLTGASPSVKMEILEAPSASGCGSARGVNDRGDAVGGSNGEAVLWGADGGWKAIPPPAGASFARGTARDINNAGLVVLQFWNPVTDYADLNTRAYLRLADGSMVLLAPAPGDVASYAAGVSEVAADGTVFVAGTSRADYYTFRPVRWRVDAASGVILSVEVMKENGSVGSVSDAGVLGGSVEKRQQDRPALWTGSAAQTLPIPKGVQSAWVDGISPDGRRAAGEGRGMTCCQRALLWVKASY